jgi:mono/diheme cytochrome c family protein
MKWGQGVWYGVLFVLCGLLLLGCSDELADNEEVVPPGGTNPNAEELGLRLLPAGVDLTGLAPDTRARVIRGSYLVNGLAGCPSCHNSAAGGYMAGGAEFPLPFADVQGFTSVVARNLTPDQATGFTGTEEEFIAIIRTGIDRVDSTAGNEQRLLVMPWQVYRFMSLDDLKAIFAFLEQIPPVSNAVRQTFTPPFPLPPVPFPPIGDGDPEHDPDNSAQGLRIPQFFSSATTDPHFNTFLSQFNATVARLTPVEQARVGRGSYLVNAAADCGSCHTDGNSDGSFDGGLLPDTVDVNTAAYVAGGVDIGFITGIGMRILSRNLTPDPSTGLFLSQEQFLQTLQFGVDFRRPGHSLRVVPHFPAEFHFTQDDLQAVYAYLRAIPAVQHEVEIVP